MRSQSHLSPRCDLNRTEAQQAALYALHYIHSTYDYGISFMSEAVAQYIHHPSPTDVVAYEDAIPPMPSTSPMLLAYSNACWGSQIRKAVAEGTLLLLFKF